MWSERTEQASTAPLHGQPGALASAGTASVPAVPPARNGSVRVKRRVAVDGIVPATIDGTGRPVVPMPAGRTTPPVASPWPIVAVVTARTGQSLPPMVRAAGTSGARRGESASCLLATRRRQPTPLHAPRLMGNGEVVGVETLENRPRRGKHDPGQTLCRCRQAVTEVRNPWIVQRGICLAGERTRRREKPHQERPPRSPCGSRPRPMTQPTTSKRQPPSAQAGAEFDRHPLPPTAPSPMAGCATRRAEAQYRWWLAQLPPHTLAAVPRTEGCRRRPR